MSAKDMEIDAVKNQKQKEIVSFIIIPTNIKLDNVNLNGGDK